MFYGTRLRQARELRGLTQSGLAKLIGKSQGTVANVEAGLQPPSQEILFEIVKHTAFPASFFSAEPREEFATETLMCRARAAATRRDLVSASRFAEIVYEILSCVLESYADPVPVSIRKTSESPQVAAQEARRAAGLSPSQPIPHVINAIEKTGVVVLALPIDIKKIDAFSLWIGKEIRRPLIALCAGRPGDRLRWNASHEWGHLALHADMKQLRAQEHHEADQFAAEFLLPEIAMRQELIPPVTLSTLAALKGRWKVSIQALVMRASDLNIISQWQKQKLFEQIGARGWRMREPANLDVAIEKPRALRQMAEIAYGKPINYGQLAAESRMNVDLVRQIVEGYEEASMVTPSEKSGKIIQMKG